MANQMAGSVAPGIAPRPIAPLTATVARRPAGNRLLASFPQWDRAHLAPEIEEVRLVRGQLLFEAGRVPGHVYFPHEGTMVSLVLPLRDGRVTETITVGREGAAGLGVDAADGSVDAFVRGVVQMPGMAARVSTGRLAKAAQGSPALRRVLNRHAEAQMAMALQTAACNGTHAVRARLARWLLIAIDRAGPPGEAGKVILPLTQEFLGQMLGVRRATVGEALLAFQKDGMVRLRRGGLLVQDRGRLGEVACECYAAVRRRFARLLPEVVGPVDE